MPGIFFFSQTGVTGKIQQFKDIQDPGMTLLSHQCKNILDNDKIIETFQNTFSWKQKQDPEKWPQGDSLKF